MPATPLRVGFLMVGLAFLAGVAVVAGLPATQAGARPGITCDPSWQVVESPNRGSTGSGLKAIAATSATDVWAVGESGVLTDVQTLVEHWDGYTWTIEESPSPGTGVARLYGVAAVGSEVWAVGQYYESTGARTLVLHRTGGTWVVEPSPNPCDSSHQLVGVAALESGEVWAVGSCSAPELSTLIEHWNGQQWLSFVGGWGRLNSVVALNPDNAWAVGQIYPSPYDPARTLILHWDGSTWESVPSPNQGENPNYLFAVAAVSADDIWAAGSYTSDPGYGYTRTLFEHWDGHSWTMVPSADPGSYVNAIASLAVAGPNDVWAAGNTAGDMGPLSNLVEHWNGTTWENVSIPRLGSEVNRFYGVTAVAADDIQAVGYYYVGGVTRTQVQRYNPCPGPPTPTPCTVGVYSDVPPEHTFYPYVHCLALRGVISGYSDCTFRPGNNITRGQIAKVVSNAANFQDDVTGRQTYADVPSSNTFWLWIERLAVHQVMGGYNCGGAGEPCDPQNRPYFRPANNATRGQLSKIVSNAAGYSEEPSGQMFTDVPPSHTFYAWVQRLASRGIIGGYQCGIDPNEPCDPQNRPYFRPANNVTRGQASKIVANTFYPNCQSPR